MLSGKNLGRGEGHLEKNGAGIGSMESSLRGCCSRSSGKKHPAPEQEEEGTVTHCLGLLRKLPRIEDLPSPSPSARKAFDAAQAEICKKLLMKFVGMENPYV